MNLCVTSTVWPNKAADIRLLEILRKNANLYIGCRVEDVYNEVKCSEFWFILHDEQDRILAECSVERQYRRCSNVLDHYLIHDVFVYPPYRGNNYSVVLLINVMYYFDRLNYIKPFKLYTSKTNVAAIAVYKKVFGDPSYSDQQFVYFST